MLFNENVLECPVTVMRVVLVCENLPLYSFGATCNQAATKMEQYEVLGQLFRPLILSSRLPSNAKVIQLRVIPD